MISIDILHQSYFHKVDYYLILWQLSHYLEMKFHCAGTACTHTVREGSLAPLICLRLLKHFRRLTLLAQVSAQPTMSSMQTTRRTRPFLFPG